MDEFCKPHHQSFQTMFDMVKKNPKYKDIDPSNCLFFDDSLDNLENGKKFGFSTVYVGGISSKDDVDFSIQDIYKINTILPHIF